MPEKDKLPEPTDAEKAQANKDVADWLGKNGYPDPDPKKQ